MYFSNMQLLMLIFAFIIVILSFIKVYQIKKEYLIKHRELEVELEKVELERQKIKAGNINSKI
ncbi:hypothetical protein BG258_17800 [Lysinibacillus fusiformis]|uniref:Uncharacterized protein n=1 Tax=Lysinibacillus fusiformis TaxID=28031 RepID=A0A1E4R0E9_9BACI|nr:hypothetical protein BG258_17800 [Lysinibacillus fusiformis]